MLSNTRRNEGSVSFLTQDFTSKWYVTCWILEPWILTPKLHLPVHQPSPRGPETSSNLKAQVGTEMLASSCSPGVAILVSQIFRKCGVSSYLSLVKVFGKSCSLEPILDEKTQKFSYACHLHRTIPFHYRLFLPSHQTLCMYSLIHKLLAHIIMVLKHKFLYISSL